METRVTLFSQPCMLRGPFDESVLKGVHAISPERIPPPESRDQTEEALKLVEAQTSTPKILEKYRDALTLKLKAELAFFKGVAEAKRDGKIEPLLASTKAVQDSAQYLRFESEAKKLFAKKKLAAFEKDGLEELHGLFSETSVPLPEEEFHRAIQKAGIQYACTMEPEDDSNTSRNLSGN
jgi:hypothetical protein